MVMVLIHGADEHGSIGEGATSNASAPEKRIEGSLKDDLVHEGPTETTYLASSRAFASFAAHKGQIDANCRVVSMTVACRRREASARSGAGHLPPLLLPRKPSRG